MPDLDSIPWDFGAETDPGVGLLEAPDDGGPAHVDLVEPVDRRALTLTAAALTSAEASTLRSVFAGARGRAGTTLVTPPGEVDQVEVEFLDDVLRLDWIAGDTWRATVRVREVM